MTNRKAVQTDPEWHDSEYVKPDVSRKAWESYRKENLGGLGHNSLALSYDDWKDKKINEYCHKLEGSK